MNRVSNRLAGIFLAILVTSGCGTKAMNDEVPSESTEQLEKPKAVSLAGKSVEEVLNIKYTRAELRCFLWSQPSQTLELSDSPNDSFSLDLKSNPKFPLTLALKSQVGNQIMNIAIELASIAIWDGFSQSAGNGKIYIAQKSPYIVFNLNSSIETKYGNGSALQGHTVAKGELNEQIAQVLFDESGSSQPTEQTTTITKAEIYHNYVRCLLDAELKPEYQHQFKIVQNN